MTAPLAFDPAHPERGYEPAVPEPLYVGWRLRRCRCDCGEKFRDRDYYVAHYRAKHLRLR